jgi:uncharacterized protein (TIGR02757 family)
MPARLAADELKEFLDQKYHEFNTLQFIEKDPISVPHQFSKKEDIEIAGFLAATISWGNRASIVKDAVKLVEMMDCSPHDFILHATPSGIKPFNAFYHRTFNGEDCTFFLLSLSNIYLNHGGLENCFVEFDNPGARSAISNFRKIFLETSHLKRSEKHISDPMKGSSAKRLLMFLRWMVRKDRGGVDFGLWNKISPSNLICPLDIHVGNVARKLGLLNRKTNDWQAAEELTANLRKFDKDDPVKYDFALFGLGVFEKF